jgi:hypothetical protein
LLLRHLALELVDDIEGEVCFGEIFDAPVRLDFFERRAPALVREDAPDEPVEPVGDVYGDGVGALSGPAEVPEPPKKPAKLNLRPVSNHFW